MNQNQASSSQVREPEKKRDNSKPNLKVDIDADGVDANKLPSINSMEKSPKLRQSQQLRHKTNNLSMGPAKIQEEKFQDSPKQKRKGNVLQQRSNRASADRDFLPKEKTQVFNTRKSIEP